MYEADGQVEFSHIDRIMGTDLLSERDEVVMHYGKGVVPVEQRTA